MIYYQNVGGLNTSINEYALALSDCAYDIYCFSETWLNDNTVSNQLFGTGYTVYRTDRSPLNSNKSSGGGVLLAVRSSFITQLVHPPASAASEEVWMGISLDNYIVYVCVLYIAPDKVNDAVLINSHLSSLEWVANRMMPNDQMFIIGDYNLPRLKWRRSPSGSFFPGPAVSTFSPSSTQLIDEYSTAGLHQINDIYNSNDRLLDLCFATNDFVDRLTVEPAPAALVKVCRHHPPLSITVRNVMHQTYNEYSNSLFYNCNRADFTGMNNFFSTVDWGLISNGNPDDLVQDYSNIVLYAIDQFVPKIDNSSPTYPPWSNERLNRLKSRKLSALKKFLRRRSVTLKTRYVNINRQYKSLNRRLYMAYQRRIESDLKSKPKRFWNFINKQRNEVGLPSTMKLNDRKATSPAEICELFLHQFSNVFSHDNLNEETILQAAENVPLLSPVGAHPPITSDCIVNACKLLKKSSNPGPDGIPSIILKECAASLAIPLSSIFTSSLNTGIFPIAWKKSFVFPVHKKGNKLEVSNYRGISSLCATSKLLELIVLEFLTQNRQNYIVDTQHGFVKHRSTTTNLVWYSSFLARTLQERKQVDAIYTDLSAAFDKLNHRIAVAKLERLGFGGELLH